MPRRHAAAHLQGRGTVDNEVFQAFAGDAYADSADLLAPDLDFNLSRMIDEDTIVAVCDVKGNTFVRLFTRSSSVLIPNADCLTCG